jgi:predicted nuclease of predicted toxin-antitoxin system
MRFLADENLPRVLVSALSAAGHDVEWVKTAGPGTGDAEVLAWAVRDRRILVTFDKDFGGLIARSPLSRNHGIVLLRVAVPRSVESAEVLSRAISARTDWAGHFSVIEPGRVRMRPLSSSSTGSP